MYKFSNIIDNVMKETKYQYIKIASDRENQPSLLQPDRITPKMKLFQNQKFSGTFEFDKIADRNKFKSFLEKEKIGYANNSSKKIVVLNSNDFEKAEKFYNTIYK
jgi:hypothetical protein